ncbi:DNA uridine endonuclease [Candidatus Magnetomoraceae bacterium gMMP-15]
MFQNTKKLISWNVNGIRAVEKKGFVKILKKLNPDIIGIQEIRARPEQLSNELKNIDGYIAYWNSAEKKGYSGVGVYTKKTPLNIIYSLDNLDDNEGRVITLEYEKFFFLNIYCPNAQHKLKRIDYKISFNNALLDYANKLKKKKTVVICGDYNIAHKAIDLKNPKANKNNSGFSAPERAWMDHFINSGYVDTFRKFNSEPDNYTWWSYKFKARQKNIGWRIDYFCVDKESEDRIKSAYILKDIMGSDHCPVGMDFI